MKETMMENTPLFSVLTEEQRSIIAERMALESRRAGDLIYQQGRPATALFLLRSGWARLITDQFAVLANLGAGSLMGEADTLAGRPYSTSAEAATDVSLWVLSSGDLKAIMADYPEIGRVLKRSLGLGEEQTIARHLRRLELLTGLTADQLHEVAEHMRPEHFNAGETIYNRGAEGDHLYVIDQGKVEVTERERLGFDGWWGRDLRRRRLPERRNAQHRSGSAGRYGCVVVQPRGLRGAGAPLPHPGPEPFAA